MSVLEQISMGYDQAKQTMYDIMKKYYPNVQTSRSALENALISAMAWIYSMFQVFTLLIRDELYVSTATELESLYKLMPLVGMKLSQPQVMTVEATVTPQQDIDTTDTGNMLYLGGDTVFTDSSGNVFYLSSRSYVKLPIFSFDPDQIMSVVSVNGKFLELSVAKFLNDLYVPVSAYAGDTLIVRFPYIKAGRAFVGVLNFSVGLDWLTTVDTSASTDPADVDSTGCIFDPKTGYLKIAMTSAVFLSADTLAALEGQSIDVTMTTRSTWRKDYAQADLPLVSFLVSDTNSAYHRNNIYQNTARVAIRDKVVTYYTAATHTVSTLLSGRSFTANGVTRVAHGFEPKSLKIKHPTITDIQYDFTNAEALQDKFWGLIYKTSITYLTGTYYAYILDARLGVIYFDDPTAFTPSEAIVWKLDYQEAFGGSMILDQSVC